MSGASQLRSPKTLCAALLVVAAAFTAHAQVPVFYPQGYRLWTVAKFKFEAKGALRHHYANSEALASWGKFRDGSILVDEKLHAKLGDDGVWREEAVAHVAVMRKDAKAHADTGGWYFNFFANGDTTQGITREQAKARCFDACHQAQEARDYVFSDPRR